MKQLFLLMVAGSLLLSCSDITDVVIKPESFENIQEKFEQNRVAWEKQNIQNYQFTRIWKWNVLPYDEPMTFEISEGKNPILINPESHPIFITEFPENIQAKSISEIFDRIKYCLSFIESVINGTHRGSKVKSIILDIKYHPEYHFPMEVIYHVQYVDNLIGGKFFKVNVTEFIPR